MHVGCCVVWLLYLAKIESAFTGQKIRCVAQEFGIIVSRLSRRIPTDSCSPGQIAAEASLVALIPTLNSNGLHHLHADTSTKLVPLGHVEVVIEIEPP